jgi:hypothetical protein
MSQTYDIICDYARFEDYNPVKLNLKDDIE